MEKPNVLIILSDQHRWSALGCYGNKEVHTPTLDKLAAEGVRATHCISGAPVCSPFRATLQTGLYPHEHGLMHNDLELSPRFKGMAQGFHEAGYTTYYIGKSHWIKSDHPGFVPENRRMGWQQWDGFNRGHFHFDTPTFDEAGRETHAHRGRYEPHVQSEWALSFIESQQHESKPWVMQVNYGPPHTSAIFDLWASPEIRNKMLTLNKELDLGVSEAVIKDYSKRTLSPYFPQALISQLLPQHYLDRYDRNKLTLDPNVTLGMENMARYCYHEYYAMCTSVDDELAKLMGALAATGQDQDTLVIYTSDHGDLLCTDGVARGKSRPLQNAYRTPLIFWGPGLPQGKRLEDPVAAVDLSSTILGLAGLSPVAPSGLDLSDRVKGKGEKRTEPVLLGVGPWRAIFDGRYTYATRLEKGAWQPQHLIDTANDPYDLKNLLNPQADLALDLDHKLQELLSRTKDPILRQVG